MAKAVGGVTAVGRKDNAAPPPVTSGDICADGDEVRRVQRAALEAGTAPLELV